MPGINRIKEGYHAVGLIDSSENYTKLAKYCTRCLGFGVRAALGVKVNALPADIDKFLQCSNCGSIYAKYEVKVESQIGTLTEPSDSPFNTTDEIKGIGDLNKRRFDRTGKTQAKRKKKQDLSEIKDEDLRKEIAEGSQLVSYHES